MYHFDVCPAEKWKRECFQLLIFHTPAVVPMDQLDQHYTSSNQHNPAWTNMAFSAGLCWIFDQGA